jgi:hypothetical protein
MNSKSQLKIQKEDVEVPFGMTEFEYENVCLNKYMR